MKQAAISVFLVLASLSLVDANEQRPKQCRDGDAACGREADADELEFLQVNSHRASVAPHNVPAASVQASILQKIGRIHSEDLDGLQEAEHQLRALVKKEKKGCCDPIVATVDQLLETEESETLELQEQLDETIASAFARCEHDFLRETLLAETAKRLGNVKSLREQAEACASDGSKCQDVVTFSIDILANAKSGELKSAAQSLAKAASECKESGACDNVLSATGPFVAAHEKSIRDAWNDSVKKAVAKQDASDAARKKQVCEHIVKNLQEKLGSCQELTDALNGKAEAVCAILKQMPQSCEEFMKTQDRCLASDIKSHLQLSINKAKKALEDFSKKEEACTNSTAEADAHKDKCNLLENLIADKKAACSSEKELPCNSTSEPLNFTISSDPCEEYEKKVGACDEYSGCYAAASAIAESAYSSAKQNALRMSLRYRQLKRLRCILQYGDSPDELEVCEEKSCNQTVAIKAPAVKEAMNTGCSDLKKPAGCCGDVCAAFACPHGYLKRNATGATEASEESCCKPTCGAFTCPLGYLKKDNAGIIQNFSTEACCDQTCGEFLCPAGYDLKTAPFGILGNCKFKCCNEGCGLFTCPTGTLKKDNLTGIRGFSAQVCCDQTCASVQCPDGTELADEPMKIRSTEPRECCKNTCKKFECPQGYRKKGVDISGYSQEECCSPTCDTVTCPEGYLYKVERVMNNISEDSCCDATCDAFACPAGHIKKPDVKGLRNFSAAACCDATCDVIACPDGTRPNETMAGVVPPAVNKSSACCAKTCSLFSCPTGYNLKDDADDIFGECRFKCCDEGCGLFMCPPGTLKKENLTGLPGFSPQACCDMTCGRFRCPQGFQQVEGANQIRGYSEDVCCTETCGMFECPSGYQRKADDLVGGTKEECCTETCELLTCSAGFVKRDMSTLSAGANVTHDSCCEGTCEAFNCSAGYVKKPDVQGLSKFSDEDCCDATCDSYICPDGYNLVSNSGTIMELGTDTCCEKSCKLFTCPKGFLPKLDLNASGFSRDECCDQTCTAVTCDHGCLFECPTGWMLKPDADNIRGGTASLCCDMTCASFWCPAGMDNKPNAGTFVGTTEDECCEAA
eukprot:TRINITY_DN24577_c0_g1_i2.p1 TRINITY_DN24577_c0_g1~~TRINITY_DN24577_c0_g1_i2.p1  ORF type:complete len:1089 (-),score=234.36 TRINITY_DN24577_c0_g1_i2:96-3362(-)